MDSKVLRNLSYGVYVVTTMDQDQKVGCIANSIMQVTSNPTILAVSMNHDNYTNQIIKKSKKLAISILKEDSNSSIIGTFGFFSSKEKNKFETISYHMEENLPIIDDNCGFLIGNVIEETETLTHTIFLVEITKMGNYQETSPMTYRYYHEKLKGTSPKNAPTYQKEEKEEKKETKKWRCTICGYIYEGENLPEDFVCPICGQPHSMFEEIK